MTQTGNFWSLSQHQAFDLMASAQDGISTSEAYKRLQSDGSNTLRAASKTSSLSLVMQQFKSPLTLLLLATSVLSFILGDTTDTYIILTIVLISALLGFWQERGASRAVRELIKLVKSTCTVVRKGEMNISIDEVVKGDVIVLSAGAIIPADCLLLTTNELFVDEAAFTGETFPVPKKPGIVSPDTRLAERTNCLFMGAHVISGKATALVMATGRQTEFGKIADSLRIKSPETDFERGIRHFGYLLMEITLLLVLIIFAINVFLHKPVLDSFLFSLALAVGLTPQLLPAIISVNLASGARRMAAKKVIVKKLSSIENFGSMDILCSDKTGTLTEGKITLKDCLDINGKYCEKVHLYAWLNATLQQGFSNPIDKALHEKELSVQDEYALKAEIPYDFIRKRLTVVVNDGVNDIAITKGALPEVLSICTNAETEAGKIDAIENVREAIMKLFREQSEQGMRILGVAYKPITGIKEFTKEQEQGMTFLGIISLYDPPKKEIFETITHLKSLGVSLKIITGDNKLAAANLMQQIGYSNASLLTGEELRQMSNAALLNHLPRTDVFAEIEPNQKERIITTLKKTGHVVGFLGDGINDAAALHAADVSISVDTAVDVAKETANIILLEHDLSVLTNGVKEGRYTFANTMKYIFMATSANFGNMFSMAGASLFLPFLPLLPKQILLTNLLTDLPEMTIAMDKVDESFIERPRRWDIHFIKKFMLVFGLLSSLFDYFTFWVLLHVLKAGEKIFQAGWFTESVVSAALIVLVMRTRKPFFKSRPGNALLAATMFIIVIVLILPVTPLAALLGFTSLPSVTYAWLLIVIIAYVAAAELTKKWFYKKYGAFI